MTCSARIIFEIISSTQMWSRLEIALEKGLPWWNGSRVRCRRSWRAHASKIRSPWHVGARQRAVGTLVNWSSVSNASVLLIRGGRCSILLRERLHVIAAGIGSNSSEGGV